jgi:uncharacterized membrane protein YagU involved in acid resistance
MTMLTKVLRGAMAGTVAAVPMTAYWEFMHPRLPGEPPRPLPPREIVEALAVKAGVSRQLSERDVENLALLAHFGYAALTGALFALLSTRGRMSGPAAGMLFGLGVWTVSYLGWLPVTGVRQPITYDPPARTGLMIGGHLVWGAVTGLMAGTGRPKRTSIPDRALA